MISKSTPSYLLLRPSGYYFRLRVPNDLKDHLKHSEIKCSLGLANRSKALKAARKLSVITESLFDEIRIDPSNWSHGKLKAWRLQHLKTSNSNFQSINTNLEISSEKKSSPLFSEVIERFVAEQILSKRWREKTKHENKAIYKLVTRIIGDMPVSQLTFEHVRNYKDILSRLPANMNKHPSYRNKQINSILKMNPTPMAINTINKNLNRISSLFKWSVKHGYMNQNLAEGIQLRTSKRPHEERPKFSNEQLQVIFSSKIYTNNDYKYPYQFWLPLLGLYTGARLDELCQLHLNDIKEIDNIWVIDINADTQDKKIKTLSSKRLIPIHPILIEKGLLKFIDTLVKSKCTRVFPELKQGRDGYGQVPSRWFSRFRASLGLTEAENKSPDFHSFRHNLSNNLREHGASLEDIADILGHSNNVTTARYAKCISIENAYKCVLSINYKIDVEILSYERRNATGVATTNPTTTNKAQT